MTRNGILLLCLLSTAGCATQSRAPATPARPVAGATPEQQWGQRQQRLAAMRQWTLDGRVGLSIRQQSWSFGMNWEQQGNGEYRMDINNPLTGALMAHIQQQGSKVTLKAADGKLYQDSDAERLLQRQLKLRFPLKNMRYWVRAVPEPGKAVTSVRLDNLGRPEQLVQDGWVISYSAYKGDDTFALPGRIQLERAAEQVKARVVAKEWKTSF
ncbi:MAG TPA: lipoprotein insertase outer membrane protein LolB [Thiolinea sp.]|nr:lipoprotein insertase outer membrane protein LolB [Thiolinea sp.]